MTPSGGASAKIMSHQQQQQQSNQRVVMLPEIEALDRQLNSGAESVSTSTAFSGLSSLI